MTKLSAGLEDYLEIICNLLEKSDSVKAVEVAKNLNISRASVSEALARLVDKKLINYEPHKGITITEEGLKKAKSVIEKHNTIKYLLNEVLDLDEDTAETNACKIEHVISEDVFLRLKEYCKYCENNKEFVNNFKKITRKNK